MSHPGVVARPVIAGVGGGCGTSVLAAALAGVDGGVYPVRGRLDVLVCRPSMDSLAAAQAVLALVPHRPVLAVVADVPRAAVSRQARARLRLTEPHTAGVIHVPFVPELRQVDDPCGAATAWLVADPPRELREFAGAMEDLVDAVLPLLENRDAAAPVTAPPPAPALWPQIPPPAGAPPPLAAAPIGRRR